MVISADAAQAGQPAQDLHVAFRLPQCEWLKGETQEPKRWRLPPWIGPGVGPRNQLRSQACGRRARWARLGLEGPEFRQAAAQELAVWVRSGYPKGEILRAWARGGATFTHCRMGAARGAGALPRGRVADTS
eukprot:5439731-Alexandrium_andersonii.AAC.1